MAVAVDAWAATRRITLLGARILAQCCIHAYPVSAHSYQMLGANPMIDAVHELSLVGVCDNRIGTVVSSIRS